MRDGAIASRNDFAALVVMDDNLSFGGIGSGERIGRGEAGVESGGVLAQCLFHFPAGIDEGNCAGKGARQEEEATVAVVVLRPFGQPVDIQLFDRPARRSAR